MTFGNEEIDARDYVFDSGPDFVESTEIVDSPFAPTTNIVEVWHYTNASSLLSILKSQELWASNPRSLNDKSEFIYGLDILRSIWLNPAVKSGMDDRHVKFVNEVLEKGFFEEQLQLLYIFSASKKKDSLNQWMSYSNTDGFAIALDTTQKLVPLGETDIKSNRHNENQMFFSGWYEVLYGNKEIYHECRKLINFIANCVDLVQLTNHESKIYVARLACAGQFLRIKHEGFADEREVRFVSSNPKNSPLLFREANGRIIPFIKLVPAQPKISNHDQHALLPIVELQGGPSIDHNDLAWLRRLMDDSGFAPKTISKSNIPFA